MLFHKTGSALRRKMFHTQPSRCTGCSTSMTALAAVIDRPGLGINLNLELSTGIDARQSSAWQQCLQGRTICSFKHEVLQCSPRDDPHKAPLVVARRQILLSLVRPRYAVWLQHGFEDCLHPADSQAPLCAVSLMSHHCMQKRGQPDIRLAEERKTFQSNGKRILCRYRTAHEQKGKHWFSVMVSEYLASLLHKSMMLSRLTSG